MNDYEQGKHDALEAQNPYARFIVDLYEIRANFQRNTPPYREITAEKILEIEKYNWMNVMIAQLSDKYKVGHREIEDEMRNRFHTLKAQPINQKDV